MDWTQMYQQQQPTYVQPTQQQWYGNSPYQSQLLQIYYGQQPQCVTQNTCNTFYQPQYQQQPNYGYNNQPAWYNYYNQQQQPVYNYNQPYQPVQGGYVNQLYQNQNGMYSNMTYGDYLRMQQPSYGYYQQPYYGVGYTPYICTINPFINPDFTAYDANGRLLSGMEYIQYEKNLLNMKLGILSKYFGCQINDERVDYIFNPNPPTHNEEVSKEELENRRIWALMSEIEYNSTNNTQRPLTMTEWQGYLIREKSRIFHEMFDNHSLPQFFAEDYPKLQLVNYVEENYDYKGHNLRSTYNSKDYLQLLNMHYNQDSYASRLMRKDSYDNNRSDLEMGMQDVYEKFKRQKNILEGKVPEFVSSPAVQKRRAEWTKALMELVQQRDQNKMKKLAGGG